MKCETATLKDTLNIPITRKAASVASAWTADWSELCRQRLEVLHFTGMHFESETGRHSVTIKSCQVQGYPTQATFLLNAILILKLNETRYSRGFTVNQCVFLYAWQACASEYSGVIASKMANHTHRHALILQDPRSQFSHLF